MATDTKELKKENGVVIYYDYRQQFALLSDEQRGRLLMAILDYGADGKEPELDDMSMMAFAFVRAQMDRNAEKYAKKVQKRSEAGKQGGRPPKAKDGDENQEKAKKANAFSEKQKNQSEAKKANTNTNTITNTNTNTNTNINISPYGEIMSPDGDIGSAEPTQGAEPKVPDRSGTPPVPYTEIAAMYHEICRSFPTLRILSENRKKAIAARWKEYGGNIDTFRELFMLAEGSAFLKGKNPRNWSADFNWLMNSENMAKVLEGNYGTVKGGAHDGQPASHSGGHEAGEAKPAETTLSGFRMAD